MEIQVGVSISRFVETDVVNWPCLMLTRMSNHSTETGQMLYVNFVIHTTSQSAGFSGQTCVERACVSLFLVFSRIGEYISLDRFCFVSLTSSCSLISWITHNDKGVN